MNEVPTLKTFQVAVDVTVIRLFQVRAYDITEVAEMSLDQMRKVLEVDAEVLDSRTYEVPG